MKHTYKPGLLCITLCFLIFGVFKSIAQINIPKTNLLTAVSQEPELADGFYVRDDIITGQVVSEEQALFFQPAIAIDLSISAAALEEHANPGHLRIRDLAHCFMKDNKLGKAKNYGFFLFNIFQALNHVRDFTSYVELPEETPITIQWRINSLDSGFNCKFVKLEPLGKAKRKGIFSNQSLSTNEQSIEIEITPNTEEGNYRYAIHFMIGNKTYIIDPRLKIQR